MVKADQMAWRCGLYCI